MKNWRSCARMALSCLPTACLDYVDRRRDDFGMSSALADKVIDFYRKARTN